MRLQISVTIIFLCFILITSCTKKDSAAEQTGSDHPRFAIAIHAGAGALIKGDYTPEEEALYHATLRKAAELGYQMLHAGDSAVDVVTAVIRLLEDAPMFNAGKGSVISADGHIRMDASIMHGGTLDAGSVSNVQCIRNPILAARAVMENSKYIMFSGEGAEAFAHEQNIPCIDPIYFYTPHQINRWKGLKTPDETEALHYMDSIASLLDKTQAYIPEESAFGTVGCAVLDQYGNIVAGTSTGGLMNKKYNRIGDSPVIGAGTYANNSTCGISCTGTGEDFIKTVAAKTVSDLMEMREMTLQEAVDEVILTRFKTINGDGGMVAVDATGNVAWQFNSDGMFRAFVNAKGEISTAIYK